MKDLIDKVDKLSLMLMEIQRERDLATRENSINRESFDQEKKLLLDEIDSSKAKNDALSKQLKTLHS